MQLFALSLLALAVAERQVEEANYDDGHVRLATFNATGLALLKQGVQLPMVKPTRSFLQEEANESIVVNVPAAWKYRLKIVQKLGEGGFGEVFKAKAACATTDAYVALKHIMRTDSTSMREVEALRQMNGVSDYCIASTGAPDKVVDSRGLWLMTPFMNRGDLHTIVGECRVDYNCNRGWHYKWNKIGTSQAWIWALMYQAMKGVQALHSHGMVHMDLKLDNVMVNCQLVRGSKRCYAAVIDLGLVCTKTDCSWGGTPGYMAPEVWMNVVGRPASDVFSLGVMLYRVTYTQLPPFKGDQNGQRTRTYNADTDRNIPSRESRTPIDDLIVAMLETDPRRRIKLSDAMNQLKNIIRAATHDKPVLDMLRKSPAQLGAETPMPSCLFDARDFGGLDLEDKPFAREYCVDKPSKAIGMLRCGLCIGCNQCCKCRVIRNKEKVKEHFRMSICK
ncbi:unnamed protein product [Effrenium voratum]|nr:unnamed protein product [Effrenium voratum]